MNSIYPFVYLASQSPRRRQLLQQIGIAHQLLLPQAHEDAEALEAEQSGEAPVDYVQRVTQAKLQAAVQRLHSLMQDQAVLPEPWRLAPILCADTTVALGARIFGKPEDTAHALRMLMALSGQTHQVYTAVAVWIPGPQAHDGGICLKALSTSTVSFTSFTLAQAQAYVDSGDPMGKAGGYAVQGYPAVWISHIAGSYTGIMGLPLFETASLLDQAGLAAQVLR